MGNTLTSISKATGTPQANQRADDIGKLAEYIKSEKCKKIVLMLGAGVSTSAGIPDFMSPNTGFYSKLARLNVSPQAVFEIDFFRYNPIPFYTLAAELYPGSYRPTLTHSFVKLLASHDLLHICFTQNIDTLERRAGVPLDKIVEAHGSFATQRCIDCKAPFDDDKMREIVLGDREPNGQVRIPKCGDCGGIVKPDIVLFGEGLPDRFIQKMSDVGDADLLLIIGTSLTVHPFTSLAGMADRKSCQRVLINLQPVGDLGGRPNDLVLLGDCDATVRELCVALGWERELETTWAETAPTTWAETAPKSKEKSEEEEAAEKVVAGTEESHKEGEKLDQEVNKIAETLEKRLDLSECPTPPTLPKDTSSTTTTTPNASSTEQLAEETEGWKL